MTTDQRSLYEQVRDLHIYAVSEGMYDAADWLERQMPALGRTDAFEEDDA